MTAVRPFGRSAEGAASDVRRLRRVPRIYIREAHALDGRMPMGGGTKPILEEPVSIDERREIARTCSSAVDMAPLRMLVDDMRDSTCAKYAAWPDRLYLVGRDGRVAFAGERGPSGFRPDLLEAAIQAELGEPGR
jgi:hypothetical protein